MRRKGMIYQTALIFLAIVTLCFLAVFVYREIAPEYLIYQDDYIALEKFRSTYTGKPPPAFSRGVKQILIEKKDKGPPTIDRCTSCHVAEDFPQFSPTKIARDINGNIIYNAEGIPVQIPNEDYVWDRLDQKIAELKASGTSTDKKQAEKYESLKTAQVGEYVYDVTKVLRMHPLMGRETRPFEYHSVDQYGCTSCHSGNGRGLVTDRAHGPVFDGQYETEYTGPTPKFVETDPKNDPLFAKVFNYKPGDRLVFQVNPIYVGGLIEARCVQCHLTSQGLLQHASSTANLISLRSESGLTVIKNALSDEKKAALSLIILLDTLSKEGYAKTLQQLKAEEVDYTLPSDQLDAISSQVKFVSEYQGNPKELPKVLNNRLVAMVGSLELVKELKAKLKGAKSPEEALESFLQVKSSDPNAAGSLFTKIAAINLQKDINQHVSAVEKSFLKATNDQKDISKVQTEVDLLLSHYNRGYELYISEACYACHKIAGMARGGVGPELTEEGKNAYPWFIKKKLVWPQGDLPTSTMPNMTLDHVELEDLTTFILAQVGENNAISNTAYRTWIQEWDNGKKMPWEEPVSPAKIHDVRYGMKVFATEGCSACHRLKGFEADTGYTLEKGKPTYDQLYAESEWFQKLFPEDITGSEIVQVLEKNSAEIDQRISSNVRQGTLLAEIDQNDPGIIEALYTPFRYALRSKNHETEEKLAAAKTAEEKESILAAQVKWEERVQNVRFMFIQEYGLGRLIGPRPNWSGIYRTDEWLMEHFRNPQSHVPRSIMPVFPFDETKFYALTYMLDIVGKKNRDAVRAIWEHKGFNPEQAVEIHCTQCHGPNLLGNGPVAQWIYPIPKNLRRPEFLRNLTKERVIDSIAHGVKGTPMPPWGEVHRNKPEADGIPELTDEQINAIADWLFSQLPGGEVIRSEKDVPKWNYSPEDVIRELKEEGNEKKFEKNKGKTLEQLPEKTSKLWEYPKPFQANQLWASVEGGPSIPASNSDVAQIFKVVPNPEGPEKNSYYIKKEYYTEENLTAGQAFFEENCSVCHGKDADGSGIRSEIMFEAKPRNLTNLDWLETRDDLRLLRSIKYGVPGTAMTPWGDLTSSLQRLQLVMYIRSLSASRNFQEELSSTLYKTFENARGIVERARIHEYQYLEPIQKSYEEAEQNRQRLISKFSAGQSSSKEILEAYQKELELEAALQGYNDLDGFYKQMRGNLDKQKAVFNDIGSQMIALSPVGQEFSDLLKILDLMQGQYSFKGGKLRFEEAPKSAAQIKSLENAIQSSIQQKIGNLNEKLKDVESGSDSAAKTDDLTTLKAQLESLEKLNKTVLSGFEGQVRSQKDQQKILDEIHTKTQQIRGDTKPKESSDEKNKAT